MTWENYGTTTGWCVDHIIPHSAFNYLESSHVYWCWSFKNMRPVWTYENAAKTDQIGNSNVRQYRASGREPELHDLVGTELEHLGITTKASYLASIRTPTVAAA